MHELVSALDVLQVFEELFVLHRVHDVLPILKHHRVVRDRELQRCHRALLLLQSCVLLREKLGWRKLLRRHLGLLLLNER